MARPQAVWLSSYSHSPPLRGGGHGGGGGGDEGGGGRGSGGRKHGTNPRADGQEPDSRRRRPGRAGNILRSSRGQGSGGVNPAVARRRIAFLPGEISPCLRKEDAQAEREVSSGRTSRRKRGEGPNEKESRNACRSAMQGTRSPRQRSGHRSPTVKPAVAMAVVKHGRSVRRRMTQDERTCFDRRSRGRTWRRPGNGSKPTRAVPESMG